MNSINKEICASHIHWSTSPGSPSGAQLHLSSSSLALIGPAFSCCSEHRQPWRVQILSCFLGVPPCPPEGISHWMSAFLLLVGNILSKLALGSFEGRVRGQLKETELCLFLSLL